MPARKILTGSDPLCARLAELLGLPKHTRKFSLTCEVNEIVTISCEFYPEPFPTLAEDGELKTTLAEYELHKKGEA